MNIEKKYEYLVIIAMIYITIDLSSMVFSYKIIKFGPILAAASSLIFPLTYSLMDIIAEVFGLRIAKKMIWFGFVCDFIFVITVVLITKIPSLNASQTLAYNEVLGLLLRAFGAQVIGVLLGAFLNAHLITKWKFLMKGRYFWLRSIGASSIGEGIMLVISASIALIGILNTSELLRLITYTYMYKIIFAILISPFITVIATILKSRLGISREFNLNPFHKQDNKDLSTKFYKQTYSL